MNIEDMILFLVLLIVAIVFWNPSPPDNNDPDWR